MPPQRDLSPIDPRNISNNHRFTEQWGGSSGVVPWPTRSVVSREPFDLRDAPRRGSQRRDSIVRGEARGLMIHDVARFARRICSEVLWPEASDNMTKAIKKEPPSHGPGAITGGAQNTADNEQETKTPSYGYNPVKQEGDLAATPEHHGTGSKADAESKMLQRLKQVIDATELLSTQKVILAVIIAESDDEFFCDLSYEDIAARAGVSRRIVAKHIPFLERAGWIEKQGSSKSYIYKYLK